MRSSVHLVIANISTLAAALYHARLRWSFDIFFLIGKDGKY